MSLLDRLDAAIDGKYPCGADPRDGSAYCSYDCVPNHRGPDTDAPNSGVRTPMRWRPDLVTAAPDEGLLPNPVVGRRGPYRAQFFVRADRDAVHLRLDDGHRFVGCDVELYDSADVAVADDQITAMWTRLERELANARHAEPHPVAPLFPEQDALCDWLRANNVEPNDVPLHTRIRITPTDITLDVVVRDAAGNVQGEPDGRLSVLTEERTYPLVTPWSGDTIPSPVVLTARLARNHARIMEAERLFADPARLFRNINTA